MRQSSITFINNDEVLGIAYDWRRIFKEYRRLGVPKTVYDPTTCPIEQVAYAQLMSQRSVGKTTSWLLIGMLMNRDYGTQIIYVRQREDQIMPKNSREALKVIIEYQDGKYIRQITDGRYNSVYTHSRRSYYCVRDEDGRVTEKAEEPFMIAVCVEKAEDLKSGFNVPKGDLIVFDEFIGSMYLPDEFVSFMQLISTIRRDRQSPRVIMLSNNTNVNSVYFKEFMISKEVRALKLGEHKLINTEKGTPIYTELIGLRPSRTKTEGNRFYFGFDNPKLASIWGGESWAFESVPHMRLHDSDVYLYRGLRIRHNGQMLQCEFVYTEDRGLIINCHETSRSSYKDVIILTLDEIWRPNEMYAWGHGKICQRFWDLYKFNKVYYDHNESGALLKDYVRQCRLLRA